MKPVARFDSTTAEVHDDASPCEFLLRQWATKTTASQQWSEQHKQQTTIATCTARKGLQLAKQGWEKCDSSTKREWRAVNGRDSYQIIAFLRSPDMWRLRPGRAAALVDVDTTKYRVTLQHGLRTRTGVQVYSTPTYTHRTPHTGILTPRTPHRHSHTAPLKKIYGYVIMWSERIIFINIVYWGGVVARLHCSVDTPSIARDGSSFRLRNDDRLYGKWRWRQLWARALTDIKDNFQWALTWSKCNVMKFRILFLAWCYCLRLFCFLRTVLSETQL